MTITNKKNKKPGVPGPSSGQSPKSGSLKTRRGKMMEEIMEQLVPAWSQGPKKAPKLSTQKFGGYKYPTPPTTWKKDKARPGAPSYIRPKSGKLSPKDGTVF